MKNPFPAIGRFLLKIGRLVIASDPFKKLINELLPEAIAIVTALAQNGNLTSAEKREQAVAALIVAAKSKGLEFAEHMIRWLVETAYAKMKGTIAVE
jgi:Holliday junction resolvasome RuvABC endonuclease subunit